MALWCPKHTGVSVVASAFAKSVTFRGTLLGPFCSFGAVWGADAKYSYNTGDIIKSSLHADIFRVDYYMITRDFYNMKGD